MWLMQCSVVTGSYVTRLRAVFSFHSSLKTIILAAEDQNFSSCSTETIIEEQNLSKQQFFSQCELTRYRDALVKDREGSSSKPTSSQGAVRARKRTRSPTPPPRSSHSSPSSSRTPLSTSRRRETVRAGKGKGRRSSYSRSQSPRRHPREPRPSARTVPGAEGGQEIPQAERVQPEQNTAKAPD